MSSCSQELKEIASLKKEWKSSATCEESRRLQAQIEEKKGKERILKRKEHDLILRRSKECRTFYRQEYDQLRAAQKEELRVLNKEIRDSRTAHAQRREADREEGRQVAHERYERLRDCVRETAVVREKALYVSRLEHYDHYRHEKSKQIVKVEARRAQSRQELRTSHQQERSLRRDIQNESVGVISVCDEAAADTEARKERRRAELIEERLRRKKLQRQEDRKVKQHAAEKHNEQTFLQSLQRVDRSEIPGRLQLLYKERKERREITNLFNRIASQAYVERLEKKTEEHRQNLEAQFMPAGQSSAESDARAQERSASRSQAVQRLLTARVAKQQRNHENAVQFRKERLTRVKNYVAKECADANQMRLEALQRRRGEKLATETEPYRVVEGEPTAVMEVEEHLPSYLHSVVVDIIRGNVTKDEIDLNTL